MIESERQIITTLLKIDRISLFFLTNNWFLQKTKIVTSLNFIARLKP